MAEAAVQATRGQTATVSLAASTASLVTWTVNRLVFHGDIPPEVHGWLQLAVPAGLGWAAGELHLRRQRSHAEAREIARFAGLLPPGSGRT